MDTHANEDALDLERAKAELAGSALVNHEGTRRSIVARISADALLDIAASLRPLAAEASLAMLANAPLRWDVGETSDDTTEGETRDFLVVGDRVAIKGEETLGSAEVRSIGFDQGAMFCVIAEEGIDGVGVKVWADKLVRIVDGETSDDCLDQGEPDEPEDDDLEEFTAPKTALEILDEKPAKKKGGKK